jgi:hypothetical protein
MSIIQQDMLDYSAKKSLHSSPLYVKLQPLNNQTNPTLSISSVFGPIQFIIPSKCLNLAQSYLTFDVKVPNQSAAAYIEANIWTMLYRINLVGQSTNTQLVDISPVDKYASMLTPLATPGDALLDKSNAYSGNTNSATAFTPFGITAPLGQQIPVSDISKNCSIVNVDGLNQDTFTPFFGIRQIYYGVSGVDSYYTVNIKLGSLPFNLLALDKLMYYGSEQLELNLYFSAANRWLWNSSSATNPMTGAVVPTVAPILNNLALYLYTEQDAEIIKGLVDKTMTTGYSIPFAYPLITRQALSGGTQSINTQLTRGYGKSILFIGTSWFNGTPNTANMGLVTNGETANTAQDHSLTFLCNFTGATQSIANTTVAPTGYFTALSYTSQIDSINILTNNQYNVFTGEHFLYNNRNLKGCAIDSLPNYNIEFCHIDNFTGKPVCEIDQTVEDGLSLEDYRQHSLQILGTNTGFGNTSIVWYVVYVAQRTLNISSQGLLVT